MYMRQSHLFTKTRKDIPSDEISKNAELLIRGGFIHKEMAGVYAYLPLGLRVLNKINDIIRDEINVIGGQELFLTTLQNKDTWEKTGRWDDNVVDNWFKTQLKSGTEMGLGFTHEEALASLMKNHINSYKDLPRFVYQIQTKFRNEARAKSGILRCREFLMKDLYSFTRDEKDLDEFYEKAKQAYVNIFKRVGIGDETFITFASGGTFSKYSHEFQTVCDSGEDIIFLSREKNIAVNKEVYTDEVLADLGLKKNELEEAKAIEVGNIFKQKTKFSEPLGLTYADEDGNVKPVIMGAYGIGPGRVLGTIVEVYHDEKGIIWPESVAPFHVHLISLCKGEEMKKADELYDMLVKKGVDVLYDDRAGVNAGSKFADSDFIGIPKRIIVSQKTLEKNSVEIKHRNEEKSELIGIDQL